MNFIFDKLIFIISVHLKECTNMHPWPASSQGSVRHHISRCGPEFGNGKKEGEVLKKLYGEINIQHHRVEIISGSVSLSGHRLISGFSSVSCCLSRIHTCYHFPCFIVNVAENFFIHDLNLRPEVWCWHIRVWILLIYWFNSLITCVWCV